MAEEEKEEEEKKEPIIYEYIDDRPKKIWRRNPKFTKAVHEEKEE